MHDYEGFIKHGNRMLIYTYSTKHLLKKDKVRFYYALKGRDGKSGVVKSMKIVHLGRTVLMIHERYDEDIQQFMKVWNLPYTRRKAVVDEELMRGGPP
ncbi:hypothetical protein JXB31_02275 [Candidatus Woesearchaeota archaeon]|nr:hypothetical protein [Candidatus Woesearchaeota archaeon]